MEREFSPEAQEALREKKKAERSTGGISRRFIARGADPNNFLALQRQIDKFNEGRRRTGKPPADLGEVLNPQAREERREDRETRRTESLLYNPDLRKAILATVASVVDGDTIWISPASTENPIKVRLSDIDAPELDQPYGPQAKQVLTEQLLGKNIRITLNGTDKYGRHLGTVQGSGIRSYNYEMVRMGHAWHFKKYSKDNRFATAEMEAKQARRGLWSIGTPVAPWDWRSNTQAN